ncbi:MAG TPA: OmpH family outer membrane protein [Bryobacteraceae bacterium]|nr:OmpH family outer membrane protein [Bryobacteraceae bacterium]
MRSSLIPAALLCLTLGAYGQTPPSKIGVISIQGAIVGTKDGQKASQELDTKFVPRKKEFDSRQSEIAQLQDQYNKGGTVMSEEKRNQLARDIDEKKKRLERDMQDAEEDLKSEQQKVLQGLGQRMMAVIEKYAKDNGYNMILDVSNPNTPVLYASSGIDITQDIVSLYDKSSVGGGPAPTAAPAAAKPPASRTPGTPK